ncbi:MAG: rRNA maturation RNase YbeY, partial [Phycisphaeraceae bacterium]|nr:rRNA maturation RNase YbeY [Phycisphaeraceae bacterium]
MNHTSEPAPATQNGNPDTGRAHETGPVFLSQDGVNMNDADAEWLSGKLMRVCEMCEHPIHRLDVVVVDDAAMARLHKAHLDLDGPTDVLSFDLRDHPQDPVEAEVYVCLEEARRCAEQHGHAARSELLLYAVHGLLHQIGYDDRTP